jgi:cation:H+ antiporter
VLTNGMLESIHRLWSRTEAFRNVVDRLDPWFSLLIFMAGSVVMIWRLGAMERKGLAGTVLGTLIMPYASGFSNLMFAFVMGRSGGNGTYVLENCLVNNVTNLTLLIGLPALIWGLHVFPGTGRGTGKGLLRSHRLNRLSLLLTLLAALFFTGALWALSRDGRLEFGDGLVLAGAFIFWQVFQVFDIFKQNLQRGRSAEASVMVDALVVIIGGIGVYTAIERLVAWLPEHGTGVLVLDNLGWLSGILMVVPNGLLACYYAYAKRADIVYSSQIGDGHICIPMCIGLFVLFSQIQVPEYLDLSVLIIAGACIGHFLCVGFLGRLPRALGLTCVGAYGYFVYTGLVQ